MNDNKTSNQSTVLKYFLMFITIVLLIALVGGFYCGQSYLRQSAEEIVASRPPKTDGELKLAAIQEELDSNKNVLNKISGLFFNNSDYKGKIQQTINTYAQRVGLSSPNLNYQNETHLGSSAVIVSVNFDDSVKYLNLVKLLQAIESNYPKMEVVELALAKDSGSDNTIKIESFKIRGYIK